MVFVQFFIGQFSFLVKIFLSATHKKSLQNFVDQSEALIAPLDEFICVSIL